MTATLTLERFGVAPRLAAALRPFVGGETQPGAAIEPLWVLGAVGAFVAVVLVAGVIAGILGRRFAPAGTLKMGEG